jgi:hypothetical protein
MKTIILIVVILLNFSNSVFAENSWFLKFGIAHSALKEIEYWDRIDSILGFGGGFGREWSYKNNFFLSASFEIIEKGGILRDRTIKPYGDNDNAVYSHDIYTRFTFIEIPVLFKHGFEISDNSMIKVLSGITLSFPMDDKSELEKIKYSFTWRSDVSREVDYLGEMESVFGNYPIGFLINLGAEIFISPIALELKYVLDTRSTIWSDSLSPIYRTMYSYQAHLVFYFKK